MKGDFEGQRRVIMISKSRRRGDGGKVCNGGKACNGGKGIGMVGGVVRQARIHAGMECS